MIKINLLGTKKESMRIPSIMGLDLSSVPWKSLILAVMVYYGSEEAVRIYFKGEIDKVKIKQEQEEKKLKKIKKDISGHERIKNMLLEFETKKEQLKTKTQHVTQILENKSNPRKILERLARDIGNDVWLKSIRIQGDAINLTGTAYSYPSIGAFQSRFNESKFFGGTFEVLSEQMKTEPITINGKTQHIEHFEAQGKIISYE